MMDVRPIRNEDDLSWALGELERYFDVPPQPASAEADRFDVLTTLVEAYEGRYHALPEASPADVLRFVIETLGRSQTELASLLGSRSRASEILAGRRPLTLDMVRRISAAWHIPVAALIAPARDQTAA